MLLAIDVGNTNIKFAVFDGERIVSSFRITTDSTRTSDEIGMSIMNLMKSKKQEKSDITGAIISSVVPDVMHSLKNAVRKFLKVEPMIVGPGTKTGIKLVKTNPAETGSDRMVNGVAALAKYGGPVIICDYGTVTKFDLFSADSVFESAVTCPGVMLSARTLWEGTARLPEVEIKDPGTIIAKNTMVSLQAGIVYGKLGEAEYIIDKLIGEYGKGPVTVVATGGMSGFFFDKTDRMQYHDPNLTMEGLRIVYEKNR